MLIKSSGININCVFKREENLSNKIPIIFLHGFLGSSKDWKFIISKLNDNFFPISIDLVGHGKSDSPVDPGMYSPETINQFISDIFKYFDLSKAVICGYSMGGRAALGYTLKNPNKVSGLLLESSTAGIENNNERMQRVKNDNKLIQIIKEHGINKFVDHWTNLHLFESQKELPSSLQNRIIESRLKNNPMGIINSLLSFGAGVMPSYWNQLSNILTPTLLIAGEYDSKFVEINKKMNNVIPNSSFKIVPKSGHNTHLEKPTEFVSLINNFIRNYLQQLLVN
jgi:2-succinyl-6-hydroxy-2,4-cyclohexadiene-1-carboxylate synthase